MSLRSVLKGGYKIKIKRFIELKSLVLPAVWAILLVVISISASLPQAQLRSIAYELDTRQLEMAGQSGDVHQGWVPAESQGTLSLPSVGGSSTQTEPALITVTGKVVFDTGDPVEGATVWVSVVPAAQVFLPLVTKSAEMSAIPAAGVSTAGDLVLQRVETTTDANGNFTVEVGPRLPGVRVLAEVRFESDSMPAVETAKWGTAETDTLDMGTIMIPNPKGSEMTLVNGAGQTGDGSVQVEGMPPEVDRLFGRSYAPDVNPEAFPGEFAESGRIPFNSTVFVWMEGLDTDGNPVEDLSQAATIRSRVPPSQWSDLVDIQSGTDRIEVPIYTYNEETDVWDQTAVGWLEDGVRTVLPEDAQSVILDGTFPGEIYATFNTDHLSWMNVDYPYIGPWTLGRLDSSKRNNDCLYKALQLAKTIAKSAAGRAAYAKVNQAGADLDIELADGKGPELKNSDLADAYGVYKGDAGGSETEFEIDNSLWDKCGEGASEDDKKNTILIMAVTILHESAHWKDDVKKYPDDDTDTPGEEGNQLERDLFGGLITDGDGIKLDGNPVDNATRDGWLNPDNWPPPAGGSSVFAQTLQPQQEEPSSLQVTISVTQTTFELGEEILVEVTYQNVSASAIEVMNRVVLEGWPLYFNIVNQATGDRVRFLGPEFKLRLTDRDFTTLQPNETFTQTVNLVRDPTSGAPRYQLVSSGTYSITAVYEPFRGIQASTSNTITFTVGAGGSISGTVTNATTGQPISGATIKAMQNGNVLDTATTDGSGNYTFPELPPGTYTLEASAPGFLRSTQEDVQVIAGQNTVVNFSLSPLMALGEMRLVLTWGQDPRDLDSHLWLPEETPYHIAYFRKGNLEVCPFAQLDRDDTSFFGPETITIKKRFEGTYVYAVHKYSGIGELTTSEAQVNVYDSTGLIATFNVPTEGTGRWWNVLTIDGATGAITEINVIGDDPAPYADTDAGCE